MARSLTSAAASIRGISRERAKAAPKAPDWPTCAKISREGSTSGRGPPSAAAAAAASQAAIIPTNELVRKSLLLAKWA
jgi:hypothetical protein